MTGTKGSSALATSCPICTGKASDVGEREGYRLARCARCRHLFVVNLPTADALRDLYAKYSYESSGRLEDVPDFVHVRLREIAQQCEQFVRFRRMLDVGFGAGASLKAFGEAGWEAYGIEVSRSAVEHARRHGLQRAIEGDFLRAPYERGFFDLIVMTEVIEHLVSPIPFLEHATRLLRPGGAIYLTTPNGAGVSAQVLGITWSVVSPPEHLNLFSPQSVRIALERAGFDRSDVRTHGVHPAELVQHARRRLRLSRDSDKPVDRGKTSYELNRTLSTSPTGRVFKRVANELLSATRLGDGFKVFAHTPASGS
jgi:SAM-dependent methyltransferase